MCHPPVTLTMLIGHEVKTFLAHNFSNYLFYLYNYSLGNFLHIIQVALCYFVNHLHCHTHTYAYVYMKSISLSKSIFLFAIFKYLFYSYKFYSNLFLYRFILCCYYHTFYSQALLSLQAVLHVRWVYTWFLPQPNFKILFNK